VTIDTGGDIGAAAMALDSSNNVAVTGQYRTNTSKHGFYTAMLASSDGSFIWETNSIPVSDDLIGAPTSITIGPDNNPVVTGFLKNASGDTIIRTIKYTGGGFFGGAIDVWDKSDTGLGFGDSSAHQVVSDGGSNAIIIGESDNADNVRTSTWQNTTPSPAIVWNSIPLQAPSARTTPASAQWWMATVESP
jgi:hypothetical protein